MRRRHPSHRSALLLAVAALACGSSAHYTPEQDDAALADIVGTWSSTETGVTLGLCEDLAAAEVTPPNDCQVEHVVRGGGRGLEHEESHGGIGCGGCPFRAAAFVRGTLQREGQPRAVSGRVVLSSEGDGDPYAFPYRLELRCDDAAAPCNLTGSLNGEERLTFTFREEPSEGGSGSGADEPYREEHALQRTGAAACP